MGLDCLSVSSDTSCGGMSFAFTDLMTISPLSLHQSFNLRGLANELNFQNNPILSR